MWSMRRLRVPVLRLALLAAAVGPLALAPVACATTDVPVAVSTLPERLSDAEFWRLVTELSEPDGFFRSDNFVSNETTFPDVIPSLVEEVGTGGVYLGVGPEQNFSYIVALEPRVAFIVDIRRQNMIQHLMYKALFELSEDRVEFLSRLFSRARPSGVDTTTAIRALLEAYQQVPADTALFRRNLAELEDHLVKRHGFTLGDDDLLSLTYVYDAFFSAGPDLSYSYGLWSGQRRRGWWRMPTFGDLMVATDEGGVQRSFMADEARYRTLRELQLANRIVPLVGDFAGDKALRAVGDYLREHGATVSTFYTSNVEQYLFRSSTDWQRFFGNVGTLPLDERSVFLRAVFNYGTVEPDLRGGVPGPRSRILRSPIGETVQGVRTGRIGSYFDVVRLSR